MLLEIEEEGAEAPKRRNIIRNKIDDGLIPYVRPFCKLVRSIAGILCP